MIYLQSTLTTEGVLPVLQYQPAGELQVIAPRENGIEIMQPIIAGFSLSPPGAKNFKLMKAAVTNLDKAHWQEVIPHRAEVMLEGIDAFENYLVLQERKDGLKQIRISGADGVSDVKYVAFPEPAYYFELKDNSVFESKLLRFKYSSLITPYTIVDVHLDTGAWEIKKVDALKNYNQADYAIERIFATAPDGRKCRCRLLIKNHYNWMGATQRFYMDMEPMAPTSMQNLSPIASVCWTRGFCTPLSDTFAAARTWGAPGMKMARC